MIFLFLVLVFIFIGVKGLAVPSNTLRYSIIEKTGQLDALERALAESDSPVCLDTEADMQMFHYHTRLCLIQLEVDGKCFLIDPLSPTFTKNPTRLNAVIQSLQDKHLIVHGGDFDLRLLYHIFKFRAKSCFDTMLAAQLLNLPQKSLASIVKQKLNREMDKTCQKTNWSMRPLPLKMQKYAALDVVYLLELATMLQADLHAKGRLGWHSEQCSALIEKCAVGFKEIIKDSQQAHAPIAGGAGTTAETKGSDMRESANGNGAQPWRVKGYEALELTDGAVGLYVLRAVWWWRETHARSLDLAPYRIVRSETLLRMASNAQRLKIHNASSHLYSASDCMQAAHEVVDGKVLAAIGFQKRPALRDVLCTTLRDNICDGLNQAASAKMSTSTNTDVSVLKARGYRRAKDMTVPLHGDAVAIAQELRVKRDAVALSLELDASLICNRVQMEAIAVRIASGEPQAVAMDSVLLQWQASVLGRF